jgi:hypothetical protein
LPAIGCAAGVNGFAPMSQESPSVFIAGKRAPTNNQFISVSYVLFDRSELIRE